MKKFSVFSFMLICFAAHLFSADSDSTNTNPDFFPVEQPAPNTKVFVKHGIVYKGTYEMSYNEVLEYLKNYPASQEKYMQGVKLKKTGKIMFYGGIVGFCAGYALSFAGDNKERTDSSGNTYYSHNAFDYISSALTMSGMLVLLGSFPISAIGKTKVLKSIDMYHQQFPQSSRSPRIYYQFGLSGRGVTFQLRF